MRKTQAQRVAERDAEFAVQDALIELFERLYAEGHLAVEPHKLARDVAGHASYIVEQEWCEDANAETVESEGGAL
jgi:hypothetical protein